MLRSIEELKGFTIQASDGEMGKIYELYFTDDSWIVRYLVIDVGSWLASRQVLIVPSVIEKIDIEAELVSISLTKEQVENSPLVHTEKPISREKELALHDYYQWQPFWTPGLTLPPMPGVFPPTIASTWLGQGQEKRGYLAALEEDTESSNLRSTKEVTGYHIQATDGEIGHVEDFIFDDDSWMIHYMIINAHNWLPGREVLVAPAWVKEVRWAEKKVHVGLTKESVRKSPEFKPDLLISPDYVEQLYEHYREWFEELMERKEQ